MCRAADRRDTCFDLQCQNESNTRKRRNNSAKKHKTTANDQLRLHIVIKQQTDRSADLAKRRARTAAPRQIQTHRRRRRRCRGCCVAQQRRRRRRSQHRCCQQRRYRQHLHSIGDDDDDGGGGRERRAAAAAAVCRRAPRDASPRTASAVSVAIERTQIGDEWWWMMMTGDE